MTPPLYREWASMRLKHLDPWIRKWQLDSMYAGVPSKGAADAWHGTLSLIENYKLSDQQYCGGVADVMKFFDQLRRDLIYLILRYAGLPEKILQPYSLFLDHLTLYNSVAGGLGTPHQRLCGIPQGCPMSMMVVALIMRPWAMLMHSCGVLCYLLADDVLILAHGPQMLDKFVNALDATHSYLQQMGATIAPDKSYNFASNDKASRWLQNTFWSGIQGGIQVVADFRYRGGTSLCQSLPKKFNPQCQTGQSHAATYTTAARPGGSGS